MDTVDEVRGVPVEPVHDVLVLGVQLVYHRVYHERVLRREDYHLVVGVRDRLQELIDTGTLFKPVTLQINFYSLN